MQGIASAARSGDVDALRHAIRLLIARGAGLDVREFPDNAAPLHIAAMHGDLETIRLLVEAGADVAAKGGDPEVGVLGWATCFRQVREEVALYLFSHGATLNLWSAIAWAPDMADDTRDGGRRAAPRTYLTLT